MTYERRTTFRRAFARLFPCVLFCLAVTGMVGVSELLAEREILFPEAAAIALGALVAPRLAWRTSYPALLLSIALCAFSGILIVRVLPLPLAWQLAFAYLVGQLVLLASRISFAPLISAVVLPVLLGTRSLVYPAAAILLTALLLILRIMLEKTGIRTAVPFSPLPPPDRHDGIALCLRSLLTAAMCLIAVRTSLLYLVCPPILVAFTEFTRPNNAAMRTPLRAAALLCAAAAIGTLSRALLCVLLSWPLTAAAALASIALLLLVTAQKLFLPPAAALAVLAMLLPAPALASYPLQVLCASAVYVGCAYLCFHSPAEKKHASLLPALLAP